MVTVQEPLAGSVRPAKGSVVGVGGVVSTGKGLGLAPTQVPPAATVPEPARLTLMGRTALKLPPLTSTAFGLVIVKVSVEAWPVPTAGGLSAWLVVAGAST